MVTNRKGSKELEAKTRSPASRHFVFKTSSRNKVEWGAGSICNRFGQQSLVMLWLTIHELNGQHAVAQGEVPVPGELVSLGKERAVAAAPSRRRAAGSQVCLAQLPPRAH